MPHEKAKANIRALRAWNIVTSGFPILLVAVSMILMLADILTLIQTVLLYTVAGLVWMIASRFIMAYAWTKYVHNVLNEELDTPAYLEILGQVGKYDPYAVQQLRMLFAEGRHADVVSLCAKQLENPYAKSGAPLYLSYMESAYFYLGDDQKLREICEATEWQIARSKNPDKTRRNLPSHTFHTAYLKRDTEACEAYFAATPAATRHAAVNRYLWRARLAQLRGDTDGAADLLRQVLTEAPDTALAITARAHLEALERGEGYDKAFPEALPDPLFPVVTSEKKHKVLRSLRRVIMIVCAAFMVICVLLYGKASFENRAFFESLREAMEVDHDGVTVFDNYYLYDEGTPVESVAICTTDEGFVMAALYYQNDPGEILCHPLVTLTEADFAGDALPSCEFRGFTADYYGTCRFYGSKRDVPRDAIASCAVTVYGRELWFAVTYVGQEPISAII